MMLTRVASRLPRAACWRTKRSNRLLQVRAFQEGENATPESQQQSGALEKRDEGVLPTAAMTARALGPRLPSLFRELEREMDQLSRGFFGGGDLFMRSPLEGMLSSLAEWPAMSGWQDAAADLAELPMRLATDVTETDSEFVVQADVPGMSKEDIQVRMTPDRVLHISGERTEERVSGAGSGEGASAGGAPRRVERRFGRFQRSWVLPRNVDEGGIHAQCKDGVLTVTVPKKEVQEPEAKEITVA